MNNRSSNRWSGWDQGSRLPVNFSQFSSSLRSSRHGDLMPQPDSGLADWQRNNHVPFSSFRQSSDARYGSTTGIRQFEEWPDERCNTSNDTRFPSELHPTMQIVLVDSITRESRPRMEPFPRFSGLLRHNSLNIQSREDSLKLENEKALKMLKKVTYGSDPKSLTRRLSLFYNGVAGSSNATWKGNNMEESNEDSKRCAICLDDFKIGTQVMVTPCNHMFHEDCILPWMKSSGQCPVCRFVISAPAKANTSATPVSPFYDDFFTVEDLTSGIGPRRANASSWDTFLSSF